MVLDLSGPMFAPGQLYVALSRVRSLNGLFLSKRVYANQAMTCPNILEYASNYNNETEINHEIESGRFGV